MISYGHAFSLKEKEMKKKRKKSDPGKEKNPFKTYLPSQTPRKKEHKKQLLFNKDPLPRTEMERNEEMKNKTRNAGYF